MENNTAENSIPVGIRISCAKEDFRNAAQRAMQLHQLPACIVEEIISGVIADVREQTKRELINSYAQKQNEHIEQLRKLGEEVKQAKAEAKAVLKDTDDAEAKAGQEAEETA